MHLAGCLEAMRLFIGRGVTRLVTGKFFWPDFFPSQFSPGRFPELKAFENYFLRSEKTSSNFFNFGTITARQ